MFYSQFILAKKGPLGTIWIAAHLERKLRKNQVADTDIGVSVDSILFPDAPIALRLSSHLLLGVVRIYSRKVNYLFDDCSEALLKVKQAFRATAVDLPPEESKAPYHSITLPETFDLDDFELPDSDIFQGNFVDHHISSRDQITLQDNMEGVVYSTSQFGLDERFGDGDTSGLDLDEELLMGKVDAAGHSGVSADPQTSFHSMTPVKLDEHDEGLDVNADSQMEDDIDDVGLMDYAQAPSTPGLVEVPNLSNGQETSCCDDLIEFEENHVAEFVVKDMENASPRLIQHQDNEHVVDWSTPNDSKSDTAPCNGYHSSEIGNEKGFCPSTDDTKMLVSSEDGVAASGQPVVGEAGVNHDKQILVEKITTASDDLDGKEELENDNVKADGANVPDVGISLEDHEPNGAISEGGAEHASKLANSCQDVSAGDSEGPSSLKDPLSTDLQITPSLEKAETFPGQFKTLKACNTDLGICDPSNIETGNSMNFEQCDIGVSQLDASEKVDACQSTVVQGEISNMAGDSEPILKEKQIVGPASLRDVSTDPAKLNDLGNNVMQGDCTGTECPAPEKMLSVPEGFNDELRNLLMESTPVDMAHVDESDAGSRIVSGKKRSYTESTLTEQSLNSVESSRAVRVKKSVEAIPDDDDLLSSILAGRKSSSAFKVKPTPPPGEITSLKRQRTASRASTSKRKVLMDDTMVLHGDTIRQQLMNTEDIRRLRKKAPCTRPEIAMIQRLSLEDQIFRESLFSGVSIYLASLHKQTYDLSGISIFKDEVNDRITVSASESILTSRRDETAENIVAEHAVGSSVPTISELGTVRENAEIRSELPHELDDKPDGASEPTEELSVALDPINLQADPLQELAENEVGRSSSLSEAINSTFQSETGPPHCVSSDFGETPSHAVQSTLLNRSEMDASMLTDGPIISCDGKEESACLDVDAPVMPAGIGKRDDNNGNLYTGDFITSDEIGHGARDEFPQEASQAAIAVEFDRETQDQVEYNDGHSLETKVGTGGTRVDYHDQIFDGISSEEPIITLSGPSKNFTSQDPFLHEGEDFILNESVLGNMVDADVSGVNIHDQEDPNYYADANDTDFLNFDDDDEVDEVTDDYIPDAQEVRLTENTGWSSRTRAVAKYLQTTFVKEAECGRKTIPMDKLLAGKTRKEASRMFFEALVLKTRDYIQVEQPYPFDNIVLRPKGKLVKSDF